MSQCNCPGCERERLGCGGYQPCALKRPEPPDVHGAGHEVRCAVILKGQRAIFEAGADTDWFDAGWLDFQGADDLVIGAGVCLLKQRIIGHLTHPSSCAATKSAYFECPAVVGCTPSARSDVSNIDAPSISTQKSVRLDTAVEIAER